MRDGRDVQLCHASEIVASAADLAKLKPDGKPKDRVSVFNEVLAESLRKEYDKMTNAYAIMLDKGLDLTTAVFEGEIAKQNSQVAVVRSDSPNLVQRFRDFVNESKDHGIISEARCKHILVVVDKLGRYLSINGISGMTAGEFTESHLMSFRDFIFDEYIYVKKYPKLYEHVKKQNTPSERLSMNTVVSQLKMLQTFFNDLETTDEIAKSPFRKLGREKKKVVMRTLYDDPIFLRKEELLRVLSTEVPASLQATKDAFLLNCAFGCRISDFSKLSMESISVSEEGIPFVHYIPQKTIKNQMGNEEVETPIVRYAYDIIRRTKFDLPILKNMSGPQGYNAQLKLLLHTCKINRKVPQFNEMTKRNDYSPIYALASSKLARKTHVDLMNKVQVNQYAAGLHKEGSSAIERYTKLEIRDRFVLMNYAFDQEPYCVDENLQIRG